MNELQSNYNVQSLQYLKLITVKASFLACDRERTIP